ncbi:prli-interacting factor l [Dorcoceras hygrometricum]|uniref:Prli-interacting factor l n=1 Tax=Dorcoceras hygrometricum TaxID=472368 RepID=A0A2Z7ALB8_9LAMI|nr:prli-interacting factor l [Dorcoceras hygrometricum]
MAESSRRGGGEGKSIVPPERNFSPLNNQDLDFLCNDNDENTLQDVDVRPHYQQSQGTQGSTSIPSAPTVSMGGRSQKIRHLLKHFDKLKRSFRNKKIPMASSKRLLKIKGREFLEEVSTFFFSPFFALMLCSLEEWMTKVLSDIDISRSAPSACFLELEAAARSAFSESSHQVLDMNSSCNFGTSSDPSLGSTIAVISNSGDDCISETPEVLSPSLTETTVNESSWLREGNQRVNALAKDEIYLVDSPSDVSSLSDVHRQCSSSSHLSTSFEPTEFGDTLSLLFLSYHIRIIAVLFGILSSISLVIPGLANPAPIIQTFYAEDQIFNDVKLDGVVTLVDAKYAGKHLDEVKPKGVVNEAVEQITYADRIIVNKTDLVDEPEVASLVDRIKNINRMAQLKRTKYGNVNLDYVLGIGEHHDHAHDPGVSSVSIVCEGILDLEKANIWLGTLLLERSEDIYRMKGLLSVDGMNERFVFQGVHDIFQGSPDRLWGPDEPRINKIVFIGKNLDAKELEKGFKDCLLYSKDLGFLETSISRIQMQVGERFEMEVGMGQKVRKECSYGLHERLRNEKRFLLISDDVWETVDLDLLGILRQEISARGNIMITSRSLDVCREMESQVDLKIEALTPEEAWNLFCEIALVYHL